jgi:hypothetical protein
LESLEVDQNAIIEGNITVKGYEYVYLTEYLYEKQIIIPPSAGADALVVRDTDDTEDRIKLTEDGKIIFPNLLLREFDSDTITIRDAADTAYKNLRVMYLYSDQVWFKLTDTGVIKTKTASGAYVSLQSHDGSAYRNVLKVIGGQFELYSWDGSTEQLIAKGNAGYLEIQRGVLLNDTPLYGYDTGGAVREIIKIDSSNRVVVGEYNILRMQMGARNEFVPRGDKVSSIGATGLRWNDIIYGGQILGKSDDATSTTTTQDSPPIKLRGAYWDAVNLVSVDRDAIIFHRILNTTPESEFVFQIGGTDILLLKDTGELVISAGVNILGRSYAGSAQTVTETAATLKDSCGPTGNKNVLYPLNIVVDADNPTGSGVTLTVEVKLYHSDGSETTIDTFTVAEGASDTKDYTTEYIAKALSEGVSVVEVRLYAYCSAAPATGYEPTVTLTSVKAFQF